VAAQAITVVLFPQALVHLGHRAKPQGDKPAVNDWQHLKSHTAQRQAAAARDHQTFLYWNFTVYWNFTTGM